MEKFFAPCPRGLEAALVDELAEQGAVAVRAVAGGVQFSGDWATCYRANLESRLATRILWQVAGGVYASEEDIYHVARSGRWPQLFALEQTFRVQTTASKCPLRSLDFVTLRVKDAICDTFRERHDARPSIDTHEPDIRVQVYLSERECTLYLDTSGAPLWQRGMRHANVDAPLKENLAAGILKLAGWQPGMPLLDPMCGGGTFVLEAASIALDMAPGLQRPWFGFEKLANFDAPLWLGLREAAFARSREARPQPIFASDIDPRAVRATKRNLQESGLGNVVRVAECDFLDLQAPAPVGVMIANPPYGERIGEQDALAELYPQMASVLKQRFAGWTCCFFTADSRFPKLLRLKPRRKTPLFNGALECRVYEIEMVAGSNRRPRGEEAEV
jgi:putative N6-adenine-specific DNA methylase